MLCEPHNLCRHALSGSMAVGMDELRLSGTSVLIPGFSALSVLRHPPPDRTACPRLNEPG